MLMVLAALCIAGCRSELLPQTLELEPGVVQEVRNIGTVVSDTKDEVSWDGVTKVTESLVIDVGSIPPPRALNKARDLLVERGWTVSAQQLPDWIRMESDSWQNATLALYGMEFTKANADLSLQETANIGAAGVQATSLVVLVVERSDGW
jgi:hypothetical protein